MRRKRDLNSSFQENLARLRQSKGLSLRQLGDKAGLAGAYIYQIEAGMRHPTLDSIQKIAHALGVHPAAMLTESYDA